MWALRRRNTSLRFTAMGGDDDIYIYIYIYTLAQYLIRALVRNVRLCIVRQTATV